MDIEYLLLLQKFRELVDGFLTPVMEMISLLSVSLIIFIPVFIYWVIDKEKGLFVLMSYYLCCSFNALVKLTACVYRPWIRDSRIIPYGNSLSTATGYSFPSGHAAIAGPIYLGTALITWVKKRWLAIISIILLLLVGFSRNYLGVHTPQDVFVGIVESVLSLIVISKIINYLKKKPEKENLFLLISLIVGILGIIYISFKPYPLDYVDGKLLVDPLKMMVDGYGDICLLIAFPIARFIEKKWIKFKPLGLNLKGIIIGILGLLPFAAMMLYLKNFLDGLLGAHLGHFLYTIITVIYCIDLIPLCINLYHKSKEKNN